MMRCCCRRRKADQRLPLREATYVPNKNRDLEIGTSASTSLAGQQPNNLSETGGAGVLDGDGVLPPPFSPIGDAERQLIAELLRRVRLAHANERIPGGERWYEETEVLRFVRARKDLDESESLFKQAMTWRRGYVDNGGAVPISEGSFGRAHDSYIVWCERGPRAPGAAKPPDWWLHIHSNTSLRLYGSDPNGLPILYNSVSADDLGACVDAVGFNAFEMFGVMTNDFFLDAARDATRATGGVKIVHSGFVIMDLEGLSFRHLSDARTFTKASAVLKFLHPERQQHCFIVRAPRLFTQLWALLKPFIDPRTLAKISILSNRDSLQPLIDTLGVENVPEFLGGTCTAVRGPPQ